MKLLDFFYSQILRERLEKVVDPQRETLHDVLVKAVITLYDAALTKVFIKY